jgi:transcriptional regulator with XRE-family HTH domain
MCELLRQWRTDADLTQRALAARLRKPHSYIWKVEAGERRIDPVEFAGWCRACGVSPGKGIEQVG